MLMCLDSDFHLKDIIVKIFPVVSNSVIGPNRNCATALLSMSELFPGGAESVILN